MGGGGGEYLLRQHKGEHTVRARTSFIHVCCSHRAGFVALCKKVRAMVRVGVGVGVRVG